MITPLVKLSQVESHLTGVCNTCCRWIAIHVDSRGRRWSEVLNTLIPIVLSFHDLARQRSQMTLESQKYERYHAY